MNPAKLDMLVRELQAALAERGIQASLTRLREVLSEMGIATEKSRSTPPSATPERSGSGARSTSGTSARSRRNS